MNQQDLFKCLHNTQSYLRVYLKALEYQHEIEESKKPDMTIEQQIVSCLQRCEKDITEYIELKEIFDSQKKEK